MSQVWKSWDWLKKQKTFFFFPLLFMHLFRNNTHSLCSAPALWNVRDWAFKEIYLFQPEGMRTYFFSLLRFLCGCTIRNSGLWGEGRNKGLRGAHCQMTELPALTMWLHKPRASTLHAGTQGTRGNQGLPPYLSTACIKWGYPPAQGEFLTRFVRPEHLDMGEHGATVEPISIPVWRRSCQAWGLHLTSLKKEVLKPSCCFDVNVMAESHHNGSCYKQPQHVSLPRRNPTTNLVIGRAHPLTPANAYKQDQSQAIHQRSGQFSPSPAVKKNKIK